MNAEDRIRAHFLGSGSAGNCTAIEYRDSLILIDCGFSALETTRRLMAVGLDPARVEGILLTHEHGDHVRGVDVFARRHAPGCTVFATPGTLRALRVDRNRVACAEVRAGEAFSIAGVTVAVAATSHDATDPVAYRLESNGDSFALASDTGRIGPELDELLSGVHVVAIETNHDLGMLESGPYPYHLKRRIRSDSGHLSNEDAADALERLAADGLRCVAAFHRSRTNNTDRLAGDALRQRLSRLGHGATVHVIEQERCTSVE